ncbi:imidazoleglycerol-phosphate dehydratase HisB [Serpentinicella sp. ANB-PHB4]|uniref:imidazoleglycerol-phosphate dehydratase HisB n=1 Tax=Serpentinicella sp. ANB-PHB4 TaxID=3074076 RepID=UPI0028583A8B|nr:imidazoleglycerol-phosphate dehydratase HisB [Serpentinicella sp. ANB-PHB4]MDR5659754.1 imidazoleglycerol-phosphate dehydratase HisB [Serpentinicella sp. ANB-PHB4]
MARYCEEKRKTAETEVLVNINLDGSGETNINTGIGFFDHMLTQIGKHGFFDLNVEATGDLEVDFHHTVEDVGIVLGKAFAKALGDKKGIKRYATVFTPMDESLSMVSVDISGRPYLHFDVAYIAHTTGNFEVQLVEEFFRAFAFNSGMTLHIKNMYGKNDHHIIESIFKAFGRVLDEATGIDKRIKGVMSTKGAL